MIKTRRIEANEETFNFQKPKRTVTRTVSSSSKMAKCCKFSYNSNKDDDMKEGIFLLRLPKDPGILPKWDKCNTKRSVGAITKLNCLLKAF